MRETCVHAAHAGDHLRDPQVDDDARERERLRPLDAALAAGVTRILVDNQPPERLAEWVERAGPDVAIEASGGITPETARADAEAGARFISVGSLTHSGSAAAIRFDLATA